jgi:hypothetical protein
MTDCRCLTEGPQRPDVIDERHLGWDKTAGRFAGVTLRRCSRCKRLWLRYAVEHEAFTASGRWAGPTRQYPLGRTRPGYRFCKIAARPFQGIANFSTFPGPAARRDDLILAETPPP